MSTIKNLKNANKSLRRELMQYKNGEYSFKRGADKKKIVSAARHLAVGFDNIDLRKTPSKSQIRRAKKIVKEFYENTGKNTQLIRPSKANRDLYAHVSNMSPKFKVYLVPKNSPDSKIKVKKIRGQKVIAEINKYFEYLNFYFPDMKKLALNPDDEARKLFNKIAKEKRGRKLEGVKVIVGKYTTGWSTSGDEVVKIQREIMAKYVSNIFDKYDNAGDFVRGMQAVVFKNQKGKRQKNAKKKM